MEGGESNETKNVKKGDSMIELVSLRLGIYKVTMTGNQNRQAPPLVPPIDHLVRLRDLSILVPRNLAMFDMHANLPKF